MDSHDVVNSVFVAAGFLTAWISLTAALPDSEKAKLWITTRTVRDGFVAATVTMSLIGVYHYTCAGGNGDILLGSNAMQMATGLVMYLRDLSCGQTKTRG